jgi:ribokinase
MHVEAVPKEGETVLAWGFDEPEDGGKATNQAIAAARLGAPVVFVTALGLDDRGARALAWVQREGIDTRWVVQCDGPTDVGFVMLPPNKVPAITTTTERSLELDEAAVRRAGEALGSASLVVCQLEAPQSSAKEAFRLARHAGARTVLNPAPAAELDPGLLALSDIVVPNEHEAAAIAGEDVPVPELARVLARRFSDIHVVVTAGDAGAYVAPPGGEDVTHVKAPAVPDVVDTTGAGDAFIGALVCRLRERDDLIAASEFAVKAASVSVGRPGTIQAFARPADMTAAHL